MTFSINADQEDYWNSAPGQQWVAFDADLDSLHSAVTGLLLEAGQLAPGDNVIDIGCGAGSTSFAAAEKISAAGCVEGVDISAPLIALARERQKVLGATNVRFSVVDAQDHALAPGAYDVAISRFGVMFFSDPVAAFRNIGKALRPGGRVVFAAWAGAEHNP